MQYALHKALQDVQQNFAVTCIRKVTDRGGENWGTQVCVHCTVCSVQFCAQCVYSVQYRLHFNTQALSKYSQYGDVDIVWAPTCENHSGKPSWVQQTSHS